jgi:hypothetical protein
LQLINPSTLSNELNTMLTPHSIIHGDACFAYFNKIWGIPPGFSRTHRDSRRPFCRRVIGKTGQISCGTGRPSGAPQSPAASSTLSRDCRKEDYRQC